MILSFFQLFHYIPGRASFFLGTGLGVHSKRVWSYRSARGIDGISISPELGGKFKVGQRRFCLQPGIIVPLIFGDGWRHEDGYGSYYSFDISFIPYIGFGVSF